MLIPQTYAVKNVDTVSSSVDCCNNAITIYGIEIELGNLSGHRTLITFCKLIANYMYITHKFS